VAFQKEIEPVQQSYRSYLRIREELERLQDKSARLEQTVAARSEWEEACRDADACRLLEAEFQREAAQLEVAELTAKLAEIESQQTKQRQEFNALVLHNPS
jgi:hypothetical protein